MFESERSFGLSEELLQVGALSLDSGRYEVSCRGNPIHLTLGEFRLLAELLSRPGHTFSREHLLGVLADGSTVCDHNLDVRISKLRKKLKNDCCLIVTVKGVGYRIRGEVH